jgi:hypothetical protein
MGLNLARFAALLCVALALAASAAHVLELPNKIHLAQAEYLVVQQLYRGWALLGIVVVGALAATLALALLLRSRGEPFGAALAAFACIAATQVVFWVWTFPVNRKTANWTIAPPDWETLRLQWEFSHAAGALLNLAALVLLILALLTKR